MPFGSLLALMALAPLCFSGWWGKHYCKLVIALTAIILVYYFCLGAPERLLETARNYGSFIIFIASLFVVSGGIHIKVKGEATPMVNVLFLLVGAIVANLLGTTGASMLLIRPWIRMNKYRITGYHTVFFIFIVANVGGCLTPLGDPPLFLGYLMGVPFWWVTIHCWPIWVVGVGTLLAMFYGLDVKNYHRAKKEVREKQTAHEQWQFNGVRNISFLAIIIGAVFIQSVPALREILMLAAAAGSYYTTKRSVHEANEFTFHPVKEVAVLFLGIFATMMPALDWLQSHAQQFGEPTPGLIYATAGTLSSALDNAPTYWAFFSLITAHHSPGQLLSDPASMQCLRALSIAAVFFGANTYIGNGPNFMIKAIAEQQKIRTPGFLGYIFKYTLPFMVPMLLVVWWIFFRR